MGLRAVLCFASALIWLSARPCSAAEIETDWRAPPECPAKSAFENKLAELVPEDELPDRLAVEMRIFRTEGEYVAELILRGDVTGKRALESETCEELARAAAVVVALSIKAQGPSSPPKPPPEEAGDEDKEPEEVANENDSERIRWGGVTGARVELLLLPAVSAGPELGFLGVGRIFRVALLGGYLFPASRSYTVSDGITEGTAELSLSAVDVRVIGCGVSPTSPWSIGLCVGAGLDVLLYEGTGSDSDERGSALGGRAHASVMGALRLSPHVELNLRAGPWLNLKRREFAVLIGDSEVSAFTPPTVGAELALGVVAHF